MGKVCIYICDDIDGLGDDFISENIHRLPAFRQNKCNRYRQDADKKSCILSYLLLSEGLRERYGISEHVEFTCNERGKPYLKDYTHIFFSISHCKSGVACAVADFEIGIDMQDMRPFDIAVAKRVCSQKELRRLAADENPARGFCRMWTRKESYAKARGIGIMDVLKHDLDDTGFIDWETPDYCVSLFSGACFEEKNYEVKYLNYFQQAMSCFENEK